MTLSMQAVHEAIRPLRFIFWGGLLCVFDFTVSSTSNGQGFRFDFLNDAAGSVLIAVGVSQLRSIGPDGRYQSFMTFAFVMAVIQTLEAVRAHFVMPLPGVVSFLLMLVSLAVLVAIVLFCVAMRLFCEEARMAGPAASWKFTTILFVVIYLLPLGLLYVSTLIALAANSSFSFNTGPAGLVLIPVFVVPIAHLFMSTSRMARAAEAYVEPFDNVEVPSDGEW